MLKKFNYYWLYWLGNPPWDSGTTPPELYQFIAAHSPGKALDLGCGTGTNVITLAQHGWQATAVDFVPQAIRKARQKARQVGVQVDFYIGDVAPLPGIKGPFDLILDIGCFHNLTTQARQVYLHQVVNLLAPGGTYLLYAFLRQDKGSTRGITEPEIASFSQGLKLSTRTDSFDTSRPGSTNAPASTWLSFEKPALTDT